MRVRPGNCEQSVCPAVKSRRAALAFGPLFALDSPGAALLLVK